MKKSSKIKKSSSMRTATKLKRKSNTRKDYFVGKIVSDKSLVKDSDRVVTLTERELKVAEKRTKKKDLVDIDMDQKADIILTKSESKKAKKRSWSGKNIITDGKSEKKGTKRDYQAFEDFKSANKQLKNDKQRKEAYLQYLQKNNIPVGYVFRNGRVHYRTKTGKTDSMPIGHLKMIERWGLKEIDEL